MRLRATGSLLPALVVAGCLERITDAPPPLDPRFLATAPQEGGGAAGGAVEPFAGWEGDWVEVAGEVDTDVDLLVEMDLWAVSSTAPGNREHLGKLSPVPPGPFTFSVPAGFGPLTLEVFQDLAMDGPTAEDPFGLVVLEVGHDDLEGVSIALEPGGRATPEGPSPGEHVEAPPGHPQGGGGPSQATHPKPTHVDAAPGAPGGDPSAAHPTPVFGGNVPLPDPFESIPGPRVKVSGVIQVEDGAVVDLDVFQVDAAGPGGRVFAGKFKLGPGPFEVEIPRSLGTVLLEAFVFQDGRGPGADTPFVACPCNPLSLEDGNVENLFFKLD